MKYRFAKILVKKVLPLLALFSIPRLLPAAAITMSTSTALKANRGIMMILSPAKTLDLNKFVGIPENALKLTYPSCDTEKTKLLAGILKSKSQKELKTLLKISDKIATKVKEYFDEYKLDVHDRMECDSVKPAVFTFDGPAYKGIQASSCDETTMHYMQSNLRIIDPFYGALRPLDLIQPYRLEMATKAIIQDLEVLETDKIKNLSSFWSTSVTQNIIDEFSRMRKEEDKRILVNLASDEYSAAIDLDMIKDSSCQFIKISFQQEGRVISVHAKKARGLMVRYISENQLEDQEDMKYFNLEGYAYIEERSDKNTYVFDRAKNYKDAEKERTSKRKTTNNISKDGTAIGSIRTTKRRTR
uniref:Uncharacterized protein n=1 Tax=Chaetoceros debilis TaxID=122233 RepID=A0A7S3PX88_9STRA